MRTTYRKETDAEYRERAMKILAKAKTKEEKKGMIPLHLNDKDNTVIMISPKLNQRQREKLKQKKLNSLTKIHVEAE